MRILFVLPYVPSLIRVRPYQFLRALSARHEVTVLAASPREELPHAEELRSFCQRVEVVPLELAVSLRSGAVAALRGDPLQAGVCRSPGLSRRLNALVADGRFDVVHIEHLRAAHLAEQIPAHMPTVFDAVDCISLLWERTLRGSSSMKQRVIAALELRRTRAYEARILERFDRVVATSPIDAEALRRLSPATAVTVVPNGVDFEYFRPADVAPEPATLVFSGKMSYHANVTAVRYFVREILPLIRQRHPDVRFRIVGSNPPEQVRALSRDPGISVTGYLADIREAIARATVAVCPITVKVGIQNKVLEAMALGLPVVCTAAGAEGLAAVSGRDFLVAGSPAEFADQVHRLLAEPALRERVGRAGRRFVEAHHRWDAAARDLEALYFEALDRRGSLVAV